MKYLVFASFYYRSFGGWNDFLGQFETVEDAKNHIAKKLIKDIMNHKRPDDWCHIVSLDTISVVLKGSRSVSNTWIWH